jgi:hypothetical protein
LWSQLVSLEHLWGRVAAILLSMATDERYQSKRALAVAQLRLRHAQGIPLEHVPAQRVSVRTLWDAGNDSGPLSMSICGCRRRRVDSLAAPSDRSERHLPEPLGLARVMSVSVSVFVSVSSVSVSAALSVCVFVPVIICVCVCVCVCVVRVRLCFCVCLCVRVCLYASMRACLRLCLSLCVCVRVRV